MKSIIGLSLLLNTILCTAYDIPASAIFAYPSFPPIKNTYQPLNITFSVNLASLAALAGGKVSTLFSKFGFNFGFYGFVFTENSYPVLYQVGTIKYTQLFCTNGYVGAGCISPYVSAVINGVAFSNANFFLQNPNLSIYTGDGTLARRMLRITDSAGNTYTYIQIAVPTPFPISMMIIPPTSPNQYSLGCLQFVTHSVFPIATPYPYISINITAPLLTNNPIPGNSLYSFSSSGQTLYVDGVSQLVSPTFQNGAFFFNSVVLNPALKFFNTTTHNFTFCNVYMPPMASSLYSINFVGSNGSTFAYNGVFLKTTLGMLTSATSMSQSSTATGAADVFSTILTAATPFNWNSAFIISITLPSSYTSITSLSVTATSLLNGSVNTISGTQSLGKFNVVFPVMSVSMTSGIKVQINNLINPLISGSFPIKYQILDNTSAFITSEVSVNLVVS